MTRQWAAVLAAAALSSLVFRIGRVPLGRGVVSVFATLFSALLVSGCAFAELPVTSALLLAVAPAPVLVSPGKLSGLRALLLRTALVCIPVAIALVVAWYASPPLEY